MGDGMTSPALGLMPSPFVYLSPGPGSELFSLHPHLGELLTAAPLIRAERPHYVLTLSAHDQGSPPRSSSLQLLVQVRLLFLKSVYFSLATTMSSLQEPRFHGVLVPSSQSTPTALPATQQASPDPFNLAPLDSVLPPLSTTGASISSLG